MESQDLRRACSEIANKLEKLVTAGATTSNPRPDAAAITSAAKAAAGSDQPGAVETVRCACCGVGEDCTASYIRGVRASFCGDWLCGLCAEAVKERARRDPVGGVAAALAGQAATASIGQDAPGNPTRTSALARRPYTVPPTRGLLRLAAAPAISESRIPCASRIDFRIRPRSPAGFPPYNPPEPPLMICVINIEVVRSVSVTVTSSTQACSCRVQTDTTKPRRHHVHRRRS